MTPGDLQDLLANLPLSLPPWHAPDLLEALERAADARPADAELRSALRAVHDHVTAPIGLSPAPGGVQRRTLIRWDRWTTTWTGTLASTGRMAMVRVLRPHADPVIRRTLNRDAQALSFVLPDLRHDDHDGCIVLPLPDPPFAHGPRGGMATPEALVRLVIRSLHVLGQWERHGLSPCAPELEELRDAGDHLYIACLTPAPISELPSSVRAFAEAISHWWDDQGDHPLDDLIHGLLVLATSSPSEAAHHAVHALASHLADQRWSVHRRQVQLRRASQRQRLTHAIEQLVALVPPPEGTGAMGVDMDGAPLIASSNGREVWFGTPGHEEVVVGDDGTIQVAAARRLLRARASAPLNLRLNEEIGGDPVEAERLGRWTSSRLDLRALHLLLRATEPIMPPDGSR
jgi:hypothetical protein